MGKAPLHINWCRDVRRNSINDTLVPYHASMLQINAVQYKQVKNQTHWSLALWEPCCALSGHRIEVLQLGNQDLSMSGTIEMDPRKRA
jgi:hypothetical protein